MSAKKHAKRQLNKVFYLSLICMSQMCITHFFPLYLKHLNLAAFEIGLIRACQTWLSVLLFPVWFSLGKRLHSSCWKKIIFCVLLIVIINTYFCLSFLPLSNKLQDVTHCHRNARKQTFNNAYSITLPSNLNNKLTHGIQHISSEATTMNNSYESAQHILGRNTSDINYSYGIKNISSQNHVPPELSSFQEKINDTNINFSPIEDYGTTLNININSSGKGYSSHSNSLNTEKLQELKHYNDSNIDKKNKFLKQHTQINNSSMHQTENLFPIQNSNQNRINITNFLNGESIKTLDIASTDPSDNSEINENSNLNFNYVDLLKSNIPSFHQKTNNDKKIVQNALQSNIDYNNKKFPILSPRNKILSTTEKSQQIKDDSSKLKTDYLTMRNRTSDMIYNPQHQKQVVFPRQRHHNITLHHNRNGESLNKISSYSRERGHLQKDKPQFEHSDKLKETTNLNIPVYGSLDSNSKMFQFHGNKPSNKNQNIQIVNTQNKEEKEEDQNGKDDWQILKNLLKKQRHKRSMEHKKHCRRKRHHRHHYAYRKKFNYKSDKFENSLDQNSNHFAQYMLSDVIPESSSKEGRTMNNHRTTGTRKLMYVNEHEEQNKHSDSGIKKILMTSLNSDKISKEMLNIIIHNKIHNILSLSFGTIILIATLAELFSRAIIATSNKILIPDDKVGGSVHQRLMGYQREDSQQIWTLTIWGIFGCPTVALLVLFTECSYQPRVFIIFSIALLVMALGLVLFFLQLPDTVWVWKFKDCEEDIDQRTTPFIRRFGYNISIFFAAFAMACNSEFILWYMDELNGFPYNYQLLYCGYIGIGAVFQAVVKSWLLRKKMSATLQVQDFNNSDNDTTVRNIGPILLGLHFLAASILEPAWSLLFLGVLQGCSAAFLVSSKISGFWAAGYGFGCICGGFLVNLDGADKLFWIMAASMFVWSALVTLCKGIFKCIGNNDRGRATYSQLLLLGEDSDKEEAMVEDDDVEEREEEECNNYDDDDWLEKAMRQDEQREAQRRRIMSCPT